MTSPALPVSNNPGSTFSNKHNLLDLYFTHIFSLYISLYFFLDTSSSDSAVVILVGSVVDLLGSLTINSSNCLVSIITGQ